nr:glutathione S-transferase family protein [Paraferrimonas haliotis]
MTIYGDTRSGNCLKVKMICDLLDLGYRWQDVDVLSGETRSAEFLAINPSGKIPVIQLIDGRVVSESNAILYFLGVHSRLWPEDPFEQAQVMQWLNFEQYSHEPNVAVARFIKLYQGLPANRAAEHLRKLQGGYQALAVMEQHLARRRFLVSEHLTIADISLYAYTSCAHEGGFELGRFPAVARWLMQVASELLGNKQSESIHD